jgi:hypothetical protein
MKKDWNCTSTRGRSLLVGYTAGAFMPPLNISYIQWMQCQFICRPLEGVKKKKEKHLKYKSHEIFIMFELSSLYK